MDRIDGRVCGRPSRRGVDRNNDDCTYLRLTQVAPRAGAWIETTSRATLSAPPSSPLAQGRGSKPAIMVADPQTEMSPLAQGRGSKLYRAHQGITADRSPLAQGRGSKRSLPLIEEMRRLSPLAQGRGSKLSQQPRNKSYPTVAPRAGAWIETPKDDQGRPPRQDGVGGCRLRS